MVWGWRNEGWDPLTAKWWNGAHNCTAPRSGFVIPEVNAKPYKFNDTEFIKVILQLTIVILFFKQLPLILIEPLSEYLNLTDIAESAT